MIQETTQQRSGGDAELEHAVKGMYHQVEEQARKVARQKVDNAVAQRHADDAVGHAGAVMKATEEARAEAEQAVIDAQKTVTQLNCFSPGETESSDEQHRRNTI